MVLAARARVRAFFFLVPLFFMAGGGGNCGMNEPVWEGGGRYSQNSIKRCNQYKLVNCASYLNWIVVVECRPFRFRDEQFPFGNASESTKIKQPCREALLKCDCSRWLEEVVQMDSQRPEDHCKPDAVLKIYIVERNLLKSHCLRASLEAAQQKIPSIFK